MPMPLFHLDLTRHLAPLLQLARARPERVQIVAWAVRYLAQNTDGLDVILVERPGTLRPVEVLGAAWLDAVRRALARESFGDVEAVVGRVTDVDGGQNPRDSGDNGALGTALGGDTRHARHSGRRQRQLGHRPRWGKSRMSAA